MKHSVTFIIFFVLLSQVSQAQNTQSNPDTNGNPLQSQSLGWVKIPIGTTKPVNHLSFATKDTAFALSNPSLRSTDGGNTWQPFTLPVMGDFHFLDGQIGYIADEGSTAYHTSDGGLHWTTANDSNVSVFIVLPVTSDTAFIIGDDITRTTNGGKSWGYPSNTVNHTHFEGAAFFDSKHGICVGDKQPGPPPHNELTAGCFTTSNGGATWEQQYCGAGDALLGVTFLSLDTIVAVGGLNYVSRSTNRGVKWDSIFNPFLDKYHGAIAIDSKAGRLIAVGSPGLILTSIDAGITWQKEVSGVTSDLASIKMLDRNVALASGDSGVILKTTNGGTDWVQVSPPSSQSLSVLSFQDPETPNVEIVYDLPQLQNVKAIVYNLQGKQIATLANGELQQPGKQRLIFNSSGLPSGTYLITITTNRSHATGKFEITH
jgi:photosystem II stability/assembly factor-like uncharacterized protein